MAYTIIINEMPSQDAVNTKFGQATTAMENGSLVQLGALVEGKKDVYVATAGDKYIVAGVELNYDERKRHEDFINEANKPFRCFKLVPGACFAVSCDGQYSALASTVQVGWKVDAASGKLSITNNGTGAIGSVIDVYTNGGHKFIAFKVKD